jgi:A/G-specific adenine glycosylase
MYEKMGLPHTTIKPGKQKREYLLLLEARLKKPFVAFPDFLNTFFTCFARSQERSFPWRKRHVSAYQLLIAEILLKQTKAEAVAPIWKKIINKHKTPLSLAHAKLETLTSLLEPLGLHKQRALALKTIGEHLTIRFAGQVPHNMEDLLSLPHIGLYTACALGCFKFERILPIVDTNVLRVFSRITGKNLRGDLRRNLKAWSLAWSILPESDVHLHNYGILDFAAKVCTPKRPLCSSCSIRNVCIYGNAGSGASATPPLVRPKSSVFTIPTIRGEV